MPLKCYEKPNRSKRRPFTARDVGRIACYAIEDGAKPSDVAREVEKCVHDDFLCERAFSLLEFILKMLAAIALALLILVAIQRVGQVLLILRRVLPKELVDMLESPRVKELSDEVKIRIDEVSELILRRRGG